MGFGWIILLLIFLFIGYLLFFPVSVQLDTKCNHYYAGLPGIAGIRLYKHDENWIFNYNILFLKYTIDFFKHLPFEHEQSYKRGKSEKRRKSMRAFIFPELMVKILSTFKIKYLDWKLDTGDFPLNAQLIPVAACLSGNGISLSVNFSNINEFKMLVYTKLIRIIYTFIKFYMFNR